MLPNEMAMMTHIDTVVGKTFVATIALQILLTGVVNTPAQAQENIVSDKNAALAINAWGGARHGAEIKLHNDCPTSNPDCTWIYRDGMLISGRDPTLAINAWGGAKHGTELRLHEECRPDNPDCTWTFRDGMFVSNRDQSLAINAWDGARYGRMLRLHNECSPDNPDCTWKFAGPKEIVSKNIVSNRNAELAINAWGGARHGAEIKLNNDCRTTNPDCTWTYRDGMLISGRDPTLAINAWGGAKHGTELRLHAGCRPDNPDCAWTYRDGMLISGRDPTLAINAFGGPLHGRILALHNGCRPDNPDCTWKFVDPGPVDVCARSGGAPVITLPADLIVVGQQPGRRRIAYFLKNKPDTLLIIVDDDPTLGPNEMRVELDIDPVNNVTSNKAIEAWGVCRRGNRVDLVEASMIGGINTGTACRDLTPENDFRSDCTRTQTMLLNSSTTRELWLRKPGFAGIWTDAEAIDSSIWQAFGGRSVRFIWRFN